MLNDYKVTVVCVTYNQKDYIKDALDGFVMQKTEFQFEVLVGDDCSTDGTSEIVAEYATKYPDIIKHFRREPNMGCLENFMDLCDRATAKYVAFCDGDDYWTDENKLQKQFDFMEKNKDVNICTHKTKILADKSWSLYNYYLKQKEPLIQPQENKTPSNKKLTIANIVYEWPHTSSLFIRWNHIEIPENLKTNGVIGDMPIVFLYLGKGKLFVINEVMSVYRRGVSSVFDNNISMENHFIKTRPEYFKILITVIDYYKKHYESYQIGAIEARLWTEIKNYLKAIVKEDRWELLSDLKETQPPVYRMTKNLLNEYNLRLSLINNLGVKNANLLREANVLQRIKPFLNLIYNKRRITRNFSKIFTDTHQILFYWIFALVPKKKNLWVFSGFRKKSYMDNTQYLYEYTVKNHPEIEAVWLTRDKSIRKQLKKAKMPVHRMNSPIGIWTMIRANLAIFDHYKMFDYSPSNGVNARTKFVNLWHGVGVKSLIPTGDIIPYTDVPGVRLSSDILIDKSDSLSTKIKKRIKYFFKAPFRELFEEYYGILCPGQPFRDIVANPWKIPEKAQIACGYPRNIVTYENIDKPQETYKILYAPTYRWKPEVEKSMINEFFKSLPQIHQSLEKINAQLVLRLHPHTWRNYQTTILKEIENYPRIINSTEKDIYPTLHEYAQVITDYSSIGYDFLITGKPVIYFAFDMDTFEETDCPFNMPYEENCAGDITKTWEETINSIENNFYNPDYKRDLRESILEKFFPKEYNDVNNSERLIKYLKTRLKIKK